MWYKCTRDVASSIYCPFHFAIPTACLSQIQRKSTPLFRPLLLKSCSSCLLVHEPLNNGRPRQRLRSCCCFYVQWTRGGGGGHSACVGSSSASGFSRQLLEGTLCLQHFLNKILRTRALNVGVANQTFIALVNVLCD